MNTSPNFKGRVLSIAGSDSSGGAGIQADLKTISALGGYGMTAITALTAQNTLGISSITPVAPEFLGEQIRLNLDDIGADAIKVGMLPSVEAVKVVSALLEELADGAPVVLDPIMAASTGEDLTSGAALGCLKEALIGLTDLVTPNVVEAEILSGSSINTVEECVVAGAKLLEDLGTKAVLITGGHLEGPEVHDVLITPSGKQVFTGPRLQTANTHGTGCTLSSAVATELAFGAPLVEAVEKGIGFVRSAILAADDLGQGNGPLNHQFGVSRE
jgi:hydroxymethylpyrimidine/phosphomethylpyrimidine kinase